MPEQVKARSAASRQRIAGPFNIPLLGWRWEYFWFMQDTIRAQRNLYERYGPLCGYNAFREGDAGATICAFGAEYNRLVQTNPQLFEARPVSIDAGKNTPLGRLGTGLPVINGAQHKEQRRLVMPAFHKRQIETYAETIVELTDQMTANWKPGETRNVADDVMQLTLHVVVQTLFGIPYEQARNVGELLEKWLELNIAAASLPLMINHLSLPYGRLQAHSQRLEQQILSIIEEKRLQTTPSKDILSLLLHTTDEEGKKLSNHDLVGQLNLMFAAAFDTSSNGLKWTLFLLSQHPQIAEALAQEIDQVLKGEAPSVENVHQLVLLDQVLKESLRVLTPVTYNTRVANDDFEIGPYHLTKGTVVLYSYYITHHFSPIYTHPDRFMPERWSQIDPSPYEYMPFGTGARMCIGAAFATLKMKLILARLVQNFRLMMVPNSRVDRQELVTMAPKNGLMMTIHPQDGRYSYIPVTGNVTDMVELPAS